MRRRRPAKKRNDVDWEATNAMAFRDRASCILVDGRWILAGRDAATARETAYREWEAAGRKCYRCGEPVVGEEPDWEHLDAKGRGRRDDHPRNRRFSHSMFSERFDCHRKQHPRQIKWTPRTEEAGAS